MRATRLIKETITLRDGRRVTLRPIRSDDAERLIDLHTRLSPDSQYLRFFGPKPHLSPAEAEYLASVDHQRRFAIVATAREDDEDRIVAVGRFDIHSDNVAEPAIVVRDDYQGAGLGRALLERMRDVARGRGVVAFTAEILPENDRMLQLLEASGIEVSPGEDGVVWVTAPIEDTPLLFRGFNIVARTLERTPLNVLRRPKPPQSS